jgi:ATP-binding cassette subfamily F protein uup
LLLAKLFAQPANLLVLDEPTNDLDIETLDLLEELIANFDGTLLVVSHDREFLDHVVTSTLVFEGDASVREYVGGYSDWVRQRPVTKTPSVPLQQKKENAPVQSGSKKRKLSYKDQRELDALPEKISALENEQATLQAQVNDGAFYQQPRELVASTLQHLESIGDAIEIAMRRWEELESLLQD